MCIRGGLEVPLLRLFLFWLSLFGFQASEPAHGAIGEKQHTVLRGLERRDQLRIHPQHVGAQAPRDAPVAGDERVALERIEPGAGADIEIGIAFSMVGPPVKPILLARREALGIEAWELAFELAFPGAVAQLAQAIIEAEARRVSAELGEQNGHGLTGAAERTRDEIQGGKICDLVA